MFGLFKKKEEKEKEEKEKKIEEKEKTIAPAPSLTDLMSGLVTEEPANALNLDLNANNN